MGSFGWQELLIILAIVVIIFGGAKLAGVGKASGRAIREFRDELKGSEPAVPAGDAASAVDAAKTEASSIATPPEQTGTV